jgi:hypothetical protein
LAARESETAVDNVLRMLIDKNIRICDEQVAALVHSSQPVAVATKVGASCWASCVGPSQVFENMKITLKNRPQIKLKPPILI